jgi:hypothetical protein
MRQSNNPHDGKSKLNETKLGETGEEQNQEHANHFF